MAVLDPLKITISNYPEGKIEELTAENNPENHEEGNRNILFGRELFIEKEDFMENPSKKYFRLAPGLKVRLKHAYIIQCDEVVKDENGEIIELKCSYIENSRSGSDTSGINVKGTIHWVSALHAVEAEIRLYDRLFTVEDPSKGEGNFLDYFNQDSLKSIKALVEPSLKNAQLGKNYQFLRKGYFCLDSDSSDTQLIFNKTVGLKDTWAKEANK